MVRSLAHFPDVCLLKVFRRLPLHDVIRSVGGVCHNWTRLLLTELKRRRLLVLVQGSPAGFGYIQEECNPFGNNLIERVRRDDGSPWLAAPLLDVNKLEFESLWVPGHRPLTAAFASPLMRTMENVTHLIVDQNYVTYDDDDMIEVLHQLCRMLKHWSASLVSVKIDFLTTSAYGKIRTDAQLRARYESIADHFLESINQLPVLRHLLLSCSFDALALSTSMQPILRRLDTLTIGLFGIHEWFLSSLGDWIGNTVGRDKPQISWPTALTLDDLRRVDERVAGNFVRLLLKDYIGAHLNDYERMRMFSARFCNLTTLNLYIFRMPVTMLARTLAPLSQLVYLDLDIIGSIAREGPNNLDGHDNRDDEDVQHFELIITPLPSVRLLSLQFETESHLDTERLYTDQLFPNLQVLDLKHSSSGCTESGCRYGSTMVTQAAKRTLSQSHLIEHCMHLARQPFRRCTKLHTVKIKPLYDGKGLLSPEPIIGDLTFL